MCLSNHALQCLVQFTHTHFRSLTLALSLYLKTTAGNIRFRTAVVQAMEAYQQAEDRTGKPVVVRAIISNTYSTGGCFLRRDLSQRDTAWVELTFQEQKDKVRHALRDAIAELKIKNKKAVEQCIREERSWVSTNERRSINSFEGATTSNTIAETDPFLIRSLVSQKAISTTAVGTQDNSSNKSRMVVPSSTVSSLNAFPNEFVLNHKIQLYDTATLTSVKGPSASLGDCGGSPTMNSNKYDRTSKNSAALGRHLAIQLQLVQMNNSNNNNNMNRSNVLQLYQQIQKEQQIQNVETCIRNINAAKLALQQRECIDNLQAYITNMQLWRAVVGGK